MDLATPELQAMAAGLSERMLEGRRLLIKLGTLTFPIASMSNDVV